jgi:metal-responsive CopG/Arc/MetJ family transcriptional regulator
MIEAQIKILYWFNMPTKKDILNFAVDKDLMKRLDDFRFGNRINTRSEAIRRLIDEALKKYEKKKKNLQ